MCGKGFSFSTHILLKSRSAPIPRSSPPTNPFIRLYAIFLANPNITDIDKRLDIICFPILSSMSWVDECVATRSLLLANTYHTNSSLSADNESEITQSSTRYQHAYWPLPSQSLRDILSEISLPPSALPHPPACELDRSRDWPYFSLLYESRKQYPLGISSLDSIRDDFIIYQCPSDHLPPFPLPFSLPSPPFPLPLPSSLPLPLPFPLCYSPLFMLLK
jgi:hypothetical protein